VWIPELEDTASRILGRRVDSVHKLSGGHNSRVYSVTDGEGRQYVAKVYPSGGPNGRDRLDVEYGALQLLRRHGIECVPRTVGLDWDARCAIYEFVDGDSIPSPTVTTSDIDQAVDFLVCLASLGSEQNSTELPIAAEACFSVQEIIESIERRQRNLQAVRGEGSLYSDFHDFLALEFVPAFEKIGIWCRSQLESQGLSPETRLENKGRTLSPSDFGFHNALRSTDDRIVFLDFEYFGWDDPAKTISDFLLHPGMDLDSTLKSRFWDGVVDGLIGFKNLARRVEMVHPLWGLKWCMILLNEFVPDLMAIREFSAEAQQDGDSSRERQLNKARRMLAKVMDEYEGFPYGN
jgi:hypothetical protein